jgi:molybdopterin-containing oxidoreductase family iron-sulfur binding subunit
MKNTKQTIHLDLSALTRRLTKSQGQEYWRSLDELVGDEEFQARLAREFPVHAAEWRDPVSRRNFLKIMGASLALASLTGCDGFALRQPQEKIVPYVRYPDAGLVLGKPLFFATAMPFNGYGLGVLAESREGRPIKVDGNPDHPATLGSSDPFIQASILEMYDPDRSQQVLQKGSKSTWEEFVKAATAALQAQAGAGGAGVRLLSGSVTSPTLTAQIQALLNTFPQARWYRYEPAGHDTLRAGAQQAFGSPVEPVYRFDQASVVVSLDADFLGPGPHQVRYARTFTNGRRIAKDRAEMNRLYVAESTLTTTGAMADHREPVRASDIEGLARALAAGLDVAGVTGTPPADAALAKWLSAAVADLRAAGSKALVIAGDHQPASVHALAFAINQALRSVDTTLVLIDPVEPQPQQSFDSLRTLAQELSSGQVQVLLVFGGSNPVYSAPADLKFGEAYAKAALKIHHGLYADETAALSDWHVPDQHYLESWGDIRAFDGTASIIQPLIQPLYNGKSAIDLFNALAGSTVSAYETVRAHWSAQPSFGSAFEEGWQKALNDGIVPNSAAAPRPVTLAAGAVGQAAAAPAGDALEIVFRPDPSTWDGRFANNGWLQELPRPISKLVWDNVAHISPNTAKALGLQNGDLVRLEANGLALENVPVWIHPGNADNSITLTLGYGRAVGRVAKDKGVNTYALRSSTAPWIATGAKLTKTGGGYTLASTQDHFSMVGRDLVRVGVIEEFRKDPAYLAKEIEAERVGHGEGEGEHETSLFPDPPVPQAENKWGMVINLQTCIGCNTCTIACQAENNIPIVGKSEVVKGREMHWIRVDRYHTGSLVNPGTYFQPLPCMQCEKAPCEVVCPVAATVHDSEGLNNMTYNRCVGTKYCSNNCPYKVRRFNFLQYVDQESPSLKLMRNPDVTVRVRGVMEKCTYCTQRITKARIEADRENRAIREGEVLTACQQACPTGAITFGNLNDPNSQVAKDRAQPHNYTLLDELQTLPRTSYLARMRNPNPAAES